MNSQLKLLALGVVFVVIQSLFMTLSDWRFYPDMVLILALSLGLRGDRIGPLILAFGFGFAIDVLSSSHGLYALLRGTACGATYLANQALYLRAPMPWALYVLGYVVIDHVLLGAITHALELPMAPGWVDLFWPVPLVAVLTACAAGPLYPLLDRLDSGGSYDSGWGTLRVKGRG